MVTLCFLRKPELCAWLTSVRRIDEEGFSVFRPGRSRVPRDSEGQRHPLCGSVPAGLFERQRGSRLVVHKPDVDVTHAYRELRDHRRHRDGRTRRVCIDWLCFPRFDSGACFAALLGNRENGRWLIAPREPDALAHSPIPELETLRGTLVRWRKEILAYWYCRLTNARTEGFNNKAKLVKRRAFGYVSFRHHRLRLPNACSG